MRTLKISGALIILWAMVAQAGEVAPPLKEYLRTAPPEEFVPIIVVMEGGVAPEVLAEMTAGLDKDAARTLVKSVAKERAEAAQANIRRLFKNATARGLARNVSFIWANNSVGAEVKPALIAMLAGFKGVARISLDLPRPVTCDLAWGVEKIEAHRVWNELGVTGTGVVVAVADTGVDYLHTDLANQSWVNEDEIPNNNIDDDNNGFIDDYNGWNFYANNNQTRGGDNGHGSHVAGTVAGDGTAGTQTGVAPDALIMPVQVLSNSGSGTESSCWNGMQYAFDNGAQITNMSLGWQQQWNPNRAQWRALCETLIAGGMVYAIAAGNERQYNIPPPNCIRTPGDVPAVITVGATDPNDVYAYFSSYGPTSWANVPPWNDYPYPPGLTKPDVCAPGLNITSTRGISGGYSVKSGTSMASPHVAGLAALILSVDPSLTNAEVRQLMEDYALDLGEPGKDNDYGSGRIRAYETVGSMVQTPVRITSLNARAVREGIEVKWTTCSECNLAGFNLYRRPAGAAAASENLSPKLTRGVKLNGKLIKGKSPYTFTDNDVEPGVVYEYTLEAVDILGRGTTYGPVIGRAGGLVPATFWLGAAAPNPARGQTNIKFGLAEGFAGRTVLELYDLGGRKVATLVDANLNSGEHNVVVDTSTFAPGVYIYRLRTDAYAATKRLVVLR